MCIYAYEYILGCSANNNKNFFSLLSATYPLILVYLAHRITVKNPSYKNIFSDSSRRLVFFQI